MMTLGCPWPILPQGQILLHMLIYWKKKKKKIGDFLETVAACDLKAGRYIQLNELMKPQVYLGLRSDPRVIDYISVYTKYSGECLRTIGPMVSIFWCGDKALK